ncbi:D-3-phosphoglycerate dehydrogenase [Cladobotryum mycophilum]|uniref:D-3-phosphoglycerate dehydrogenase n=1 Tax=Cladobotryum mycophilum TaxID=491253 RepID=A0ABR0SGV3_9HYPO
MPITSSDKLLVHAPLPAPPGWLDAVAKRFPQLTVRWEIAGATNWGPVSADTLPDEVLQGVTLLAVYPPVKPDKIPDVRFVQLISAGHDLWRGNAKYLDEGVVFCNAGGAHPPQIAEWVIGSWLSFSHRLDYFREQQIAQEWNFRTIGTHPTTDSAGLRMGILGYGAIGRQVARLAQALGMEIYAYTQSPRLTAESRRVPDNTYIVPNLGDSEGVIPTKWFHGAGVSAINEFLGQDLDILVLSLPSSPATDGIIGKEQFQIMSKTKTFVSNVARGTIVNTDALVEALNEGLIRGAALDVTDPEPLPKGHPLWTCPNVYISPHRSFNSSKLVSRLADIVFQNLDRLDKGEPLLNVIKRS